MRLHLLAHLPKVIWPTAMKIIELSHMNQIQTKPKAKMCRSKELRLPTQKSLYHHLISKSWLRHQHRHKINHHLQNLVVKFLRHHCFRRDPIGSKFGMTSHKKISVLYNLCWDNNYVSVNKTLKLTTTASIMLLNSFI